MLTFTLCRCPFRYELEAVFRIFAGSAKLLIAEGDTPPEGMLLIPKTRY